MQEKARFKCGLSRLKERMHTAICYELSHFIAERISHDRKVSFLIPAHILFSTDSYAANAPRNAVATQVPYARYSSPVGSWS